MMSPTGSDVLPWLLIEASQEGVLRFATAVPSAHPRISEVREIDATGVPTFTDVLQQYERESGNRLLGLRCAMAIAGAAKGDAISLVRSRWTISRTGLSGIFGNPVTILNDVAARAWATRSGTATIETIRGVGRPTMSQPGRYGMIIVEEGVGAAAIDVDRESGIRILETEAGHTDFAPASDREEKLSKALRGANAVVSWEKMLMLDRRDPLWGQACPDVPETERPRILAAMLGRFAINLMHNFGAWQGVMLTGSRAGRMLDGGSRPYFDTAFATRRNFSRLVVGAPVCRVDQHEAVLTGAAQCMAHALQPSFTAQAA